MQSGLLADRAHPLIGKVDFLQKISGFCEESLFGIQLSPFIDRYFYAMKLHGQEGQLISVMIQTLTAARWAISFKEQTILHLDFFTTTNGKNYVSR